MVEIWERGITHFQTHPTAFPALGVGVRAFLNYFAWVLCLSMG